MTNPYTDIAFTPAVKRVQQRMGTRDHNRRLEASAAERRRLGAGEASFLAERDGFFLASVGETGWPYVQFRGGPVGFLRTLDDQTIGWADFRGNRQYISVGNITAGTAPPEDAGRIAIIAMDWVHRRRLKLFGHARIVHREEDPELLDRLAPQGYPARVERAVVVMVEGFDWNCPQHITPRYTEVEIDRALSPMRDRIAELEAENASLRARLSDAVRPPEAERLASTPAAV